MGQEKAKPALLVLNDPYAMRINKELAQEIGFENSVMLLQLEFLIRTSNNLRDGRWWTFQSLSDLNEKYFPWWSKPTLSRIIKDLAERKLITIGNYNKQKLDRTQWFALNEAGIGQLKSVQLSKTVIFQNEKCTFQNEKCTFQNEKCTFQNETTIPETTTEITTEKKENTHVELKLDESVSSSSPTGKTPSTLETNITQVFEHWKEVMDKRTNCAMSKGDKYWKAIEGRLREGFTVAELKQAINGCARSAFHMGLEEGKPKKFNCLTLICRDKVKVENFIEIELNISKPNATAIATYHPSQQQPLPPARLNKVEQNLKNVEIARSMFDQLRARKQAQNE